MHLLNPLYSLVQACKLLYCENKNEREVVVRGRLCVKYGTRLKLWNHQNLIKLIKFAEMHVINNGHG